MKINYTSTYMKAIVFNNKTLGSQSNQYAQLDQGGDILSNLNFEIKNLNKIAQGQGNFQ